MNQDYQNSAETAPSADLGYLLFFAAALIFSIVKITLDNTGAKSLKDVACQYRSIMTCLCHQVC